MESLGFQELLDGLGMDTPEDAASEISVEANRWRNAIRDIYGLRDGVIKSRFDGQSSQRDVENNFNTLLRVCDQYLEEIRITEKIPKSVSDERKDYRDVLRKHVKDEMLENTWFRMLKRMDSAVGCMADYAEGPLRAHTIMSDYSPENLEKQKRGTMDGVFSYIISFELDREGRNAIRAEQTAHSGSKIPARGTKIPRFSTSRLNFGLKDVLQPKEQLIGLSEEEVEEVRERIAGGLRSYRDVRKMFSNKLRRKMRLERVLLDNDNVLEVMLGEVKPRTPFDVASGHPLPLYLRNVISEDAELSERGDGILEAYMIDLGGLQCSQAGIYDIFFDLVYGDPQQRVWVVNNYLTALGYDPIPAFDRLPAEKVVDPQSDFNMYDGPTLKKIASYSFTAPPTGMVV